MSILVVLELDVPTNVRILGPGLRPADPQGPVRRAHAARAHPDASGACGPLTLCGLENGDMTLGPHRTADLDQPWWPSRWHACSVCETARQGIVLLQNDGILPLAADTAAHIAVIGGYSQLGVPIGTGSSAVVPPGGYAAVIPVGGGGHMGVGRNVHLLPSSPVAAKR